MAANLSFPFLFFCINRFKVIKTSFLFFSGSEFSAKTASLPTSAGNPWTESHSLLMSLYFIQQRMPKPKLSIVMNEKKQQIWGTNCL